jgi:hypothetical protein
MLVSLVLPEQGDRIARSRLTAVTGKATLSGRENVELKVNMPTAHRACIDI